jgi:hypothetical protein
LDNAVIAAEIEEDEDNEIDLSVPRGKRIKKVKEVEPDILEDEIDIENMSLAQVLKVR